jgi:ribosomal protein S18 acetylase RimI-like enzyme
MITIRKARATDLPLLQKFEKEFDRDQRKIVLKERPDLGLHMKRAPGRTKAFAKWAYGWIRSKKALVLIAVADSKPVGFCASWIQTNPPASLPKLYGFIGYLFVKQSYRGQGISSMMMEETLRWFAKRKIKDVALTVIEGNIPARAIYRKWGFDDVWAFVWKRN